MSGIINDYFVGNGLQIPTTVTGNVFGTPGTIFQNGTIFMHSFGGTNTFLGAAAGNLTLTGFSSVGIGTSALSNLTSGGFNTAAGFLSQGNVSTGNNNASWGAASLGALTTGSSNTALGNSSLNSLITGSNNIAIGLSAASTFAGAESNNIIIGTPAVIADSATIRLGLPGTQVKTFIAGIASVATTNTQLVTINSVTSQIGGLAAPLPIALGGTNQTVFSDTDGTVYFDGARLDTTSPGVATYVLTSNGPGVAPSYQPASGGTGGTPVSFLAYQASNGGTSNNGVGYGLGSTVILTEVFDVGGDFYPGDGAGFPATFTAPIAGVYQFEFGCKAIQSSPGVFPTIQIVANTAIVTPIATVEQALSAPGAQADTTSLLVELGIGDLVTFNMFNSPSYGGTVNAIATVQGRALPFITWVSGVLIQVTVASGGVSTLTSDSGTATQVAGNINIIGGGTVTTSAVGDTVTITGAGGGLSTLTGNNASVATQSAGNINLVTANSTVIFTGAGSTETLQLGGDGNGNIIIGTNPAGLVGGGGSSNVGLGTLALNDIDVGTYNTAIGLEASQHGTSGAQNTAVGACALQANVIGGNNVAIGMEALNASTDASGTNTAVGHWAMRLGATGNNNTAIGESALYGLDGGGSSNIAVGSSSLPSASFTGSNNAVLGAFAGLAYTGAETGNILVGYNNHGVVGDTQTTRIGFGQGAPQTACFIDGIQGVVPGGTLNMVTIDTGTGQMGSTALPGAGGVSTLTSDSGTATQVAGNINIIGGGTVTTSAVGDTVTITGAGGGLSTLTGNNASVATQSAGNINLVTANSTVIFTGAGSTETLQFGGDLNGNIIIGDNPAGLVGGGGAENVGLGSLALNDITSGSHNVAIGNNASQHGTSAADNVAVGFQALQTNVLGQQNVAIGFDALNASIDTTGSNTAVGWEAMRLGSTGNNNTAIGNSAFLGLDGGSSNVALGSGAAGTGTLTGSNNTILGAFTAGAYTGAESGNILLGYNLSGLVGESNATRIGFSGGSLTTSQTTCFIDGIQGVVPGGTLNMVTIDTGTGQMGSTALPGQVMPIKDIAFAQSPYTVLPGDYYIGVVTSGGAVSVSLPNAPAAGTVFIIKDVTGNAAANNITITAVGGTLIDGQSAFVMDTAFESVSLVYNVDLVVGYQVF